MHYSATLASESETTELVSNNIIFVAFRFAKLTIQK